MNMHEAEETILLPKNVSIIYFSMNMTSLLGFCYLINKPTHMSHLF